MPHPSRRQERARAASWIVVATIVAAGLVTGRPVGGPPAVLAADASAPVEGSAGPSTDASGVPVPPAPDAPAVPPASGAPEGPDLDASSDPTDAPPSGGPPSAPPSVAPPPSPPGPPRPAAYPSQCVNWPDARRRADELLVNRWQLGLHPVVTLTADRSWTEDPLRDRNWQYVDHTLIATLSLFEAWYDTGDERYRARASAILQDWVRDNPRFGAPSIWSWNDHSTAWRAMVLACATEFLPRDPWLDAALRLHGATLADPAFYVKTGNHALNQNLGLLEVAHVLGRSDWQTLAVSRLGTLAAASIDDQGVTNEQSIGYQRYNETQYRMAARRLTALGITAPASFSRIALMPRFLAYATLPNGQYEMFGDTDRETAMAIPGTWAEFAATQGRSGPRPPDTVAVYRAGYLFARSGWGTSRAYADEVAIGFRWGPGRFLHGHLDHGSLSVYGWGARLIADPGKYTYNTGPYRTWFTGRSAHNVVTVDGVSWSPSRISDLLNQSRSSTMVTARVRMLGNTGVGHVRGIVFSRRLNYVLVDDRLTSSTFRTYRQLWHLTEDARPALASWHVRTQRARGNVQIRQLITSGVTSRVLTGRTSPIQGWLAWEYNHRIPAPTVEFRRAGTNVRFLTLIVTAPGTPSSGVSELRLTSTGYSVKIKIGAKYERVVVNGSTTTITPLN